MSYLKGLLIVFDVVPVDVVVRTNRLSELGADNHARSLRSRPACKQHNTTTSMLKGRLKETHGDAKGDTRASQVSSVVRNRPRILLELLQSFGQLELGLLDGQKKARCRT